MKKGFYVAKTGHHVLLRDGKWTVRKAGNINATKNFDSQDEAVAFAKEKAKKLHSVLYIFGKNGRIRDRLSYEK